jgi:hypothetical protein
MPRTKQSQKQKQTVSQKVIVNVQSPKKAKRKRRVARKKEQPQGESSYFQATSPPIVAYQHSYVVPQPPTINPLPRVQTIAQMQPQLQDLGVVGTEGAVEILSLPSRREQLEELSTPVPKAFEPTFQPSQLSASSTNVEPGINPSNMADMENQISNAIVESTPEPKAVAPKQKKARRTGKQIREELDAQYEVLYGYPPKSNISNKQLKAILYAQRSTKKTQEKVGKILGKNEKA